MPGAARSVLLDQKLETDSRGTWVRLDHSTDGDEDLAEKVQAFQSLPNLAGMEAARWLRENARDNDGMSKTRVLVTEDRVEGFISTAFDTVELTNGAMRRLTVPKRLHRRRVPGFVVCWVARHADSDIPGVQLMLTAVGLARMAKQNSGLVAFAVDPHDEETSKMWRSDPYNFQLCREQPDSDRPTRLFIPI
jgi:hypothetical protein